MQTLLLFDIDSVLVDPQGYWAGIEHTLSGYAQEMGYGAAGVPTRADIQVFEAVGLSSEWDSCAVCVAGLLVASAQGPAVGISRVLPEGYYRTLAERIGVASVPGERIAHTALRVLLADAPEDLHGYLRGLLEDTHAIARTPVTQVFQNYVLGHERYAAAYGLPVRFESPSLLSTHDRALLTAEGRARLVRLRENGARVSLYTARPSGPPYDVKVSAHGYSPEAELAAELVDLRGVPLIGFGRVAWLAAARGRTADAYVKPSPVQALAAIGAAYADCEAPALHAAAALVEDGVLSGPLAELRENPVRVIVFEDTARGGLAVVDAVERLRALGCVAQVYVVGIAAPGGVKWAALEAVAAVRVADVNAGLTWVLHG